MKIAVSENFRKMTVRAILSIVLFVIVYFLLIGLAIGLTIFLGYTGLLLFGYHPSAITLGIALGLISMGLLILIFLVKFIFNQHTVDRSHLIELTREEEPQLFDFIGGIVREVKTDLPKKIYLSADVNAAVFYDSSFWSMFLPIKKNLQIGLGLVNSVSALEFKAILAHEFGHFSQRSMKVGSYVYNVNYALHNMLYDNESYSFLAQKWANLNSYFSFFVGIAVRIVRGIQWLLKKMYEFVNVSYMGLSREMEFHADEVAANLAGSRALITSLLRLGFADHAYNTVIDYYNEKLSISESTHNLFPQQQYVMNFLATKSELPFENGLPQVSTEHLNKYNKSRLVLDNQWASHPSTEDRIKHLEKLAIACPVPDVGPAAGLFTNLGKLQVRVTSQLFAKVSYPETVVTKTDQQFIEDFTRQYQENTFNELYNGYYDAKNPSLFDDLPAEGESAKTTTDLLFSNVMVDLVSTAAALRSDMNTLQYIAQGVYKIKSFDYDGIKYTPTECAELLPKLSKELETTEEEVLQNDRNIYRHFLKLEKERGSEGQLRDLYQTFFKTDKAYDKLFETYVKMANATDFMQQETPFEVIKNRIGELSEVEEEFKKEIGYLLQETVYQEIITAEIRGTFEGYLAQKHRYFYEQKYNDEALAILFACLNHYNYLLSKSLFVTKKKLLDYQAELEFDPTSHRPDVLV